MSKFSQGQGNQGIEGLGLSMKTENALDVTSIKLYWVTEAEEALTVADHLLEKGDYSYALFFGHLAVEKLIKGIYVERQKEHAPPLHNLQRLARLAGIALDESQIDTLILISSFSPPYTFLSKRWHLM